MGIAVFQQNALEAIASEETPPANCRKPSVFQNAAPELCYPAKADLVNKMTQGSFRSEFLCSHRAHTAQAQSRLLSSF